MSYTVEIDHDGLIEALEDFLHNVYENIQEQDKVLEIRIHSRLIEIVIGDEERDA